MYESKQLLFSTISLTMFKKPQIFDWLNLPQVLQIQITLFSELLYWTKKPLPISKKIFLTWYLE